MNSKMTLGDIAEVVMGQSPIGESCNQKGLGLPLLNGPTEFGFKHPQPVQFTTDSKRESNNGDLLFCVRGSTTGKMNWANQPYSIGRGLAAIRGKNGYPNIFIRAIIEYKLDSLLAKATGSTFPNVSRDLICSLDIPRTSCGKAIQIAAIIEPIDDRISLLRETNTTLEAIAQTLFKSWFVDFDPVKAKAEGCLPEGMDEATAALFPNEFEESALGLIPKGWRVGVLSDCCQKVESGGTPKRNNSEYWDGDIGWLTSGEVRNLIVLDTKEKITLLGVKDSSAKIWPVGTTVVAMYGATAGEICLLAKAVTANQACCGLIPLSEARAFLFFITRRESKSLADKSSGSAQQNLNKGLVSNHTILLPPLNLMAVFESVAGALIDKWIENEKQSQTLTSLRDTLLPRLISGQLRLNQAQEIMDEVGA